MSNPSKFLAISLLCVAMAPLQGCLRYLTHERSEAIVKNVDIDQSLIVAEDELKKGGWGSVLTLWALRDQYIGPDQARKIAGLYFKYVNSLTRNFSIWHLTWAVSDMYRLGDDSVKTVLAAARSDASVRAARLKGLADKFVNGSRIYMGDAHSGGRAYARRHLVAPGNERYLQSAEEYEKKGK